MAELLKTLFLVLLLTFPGCEWMESPETTYADLDAAKNANAVGRGKWIPEFLPHSARNIREKHNIDTNESWLTFQLGSNDLGPMVASCSETTQSQIIRPRKSPGRWWPKTLVQSSEDNEALRRLKFYRCVDGGEVAVDFQTKEVFYWDRAERPPDKPA